MNQILAHLDAAIAALKTAKQTARGWEIITIDKNLASLVATRDEVRRLPGAGPAR